MYQRFRYAFCLGAALLAVWGLPTAARAEHFEIPVHDPVMIHHDGVYYLYATGRGVAAFRSTDMTEWERLGPTFAATPDWADQQVPLPQRFRRFEGPQRRGGRRLWAPDITAHQGKFYLYYSVSSPGSINSAIGVATNTTLDPNDERYQWHDHGPVVQSVAGRDLFNAIDPNLVFDEEGTPWLAFGSFWSGLKLVRLDDNLVEVAKPEQWHTIAARHRYWKLDDTDGGDPMNGAIEAPFIFKKDGTFYLFASWDLCCRGANSTYKVVVGRSDRVTGPYVDKEGEPMRFGGGSLVVAGNERWPGVGHNAAYTFDGTDYLVFHGYDATDRGRSKLWIEPIRWDEEGWPTVRLE